jgi:hypothetical protein
MRDRRHKGAGPELIVLIADLRSLEIRIGYPAIDDPTRFRLRRMEATLAAPRLPDSLRAAKPERAAQVAGARAGGASPAKITEWRTRADCATASIGATAI